MLMKQYTAGALLLVSAFLAVSSAQTCQPTQTVQHYYVNEACTGALQSGGPVYFQPPNNMTIPQYGMVDFSATVKCTQGTTGNLGNGCPFQTIVDKYDYSKVDQRRPKLPFLFNSQNMFFSTQQQRTNTLVFPNTGVQNKFNPNQGLASPGVFTFNLYAQSVCGKTKSNDVTLVARCPPIPTACGIVRVAKTRAVVSQNSQGVFQVQQGTNYVLDGTNSHAFHFRMPSRNFSNFNITTAIWNVTTGSVGVQYEFTNQAQWNQVKPSECALNDQGSCSCAAGNAKKCLQRYIRFNTAGAFEMNIEVSDGCSYASSKVSVNVGCSCTPTAMANWAPTLNTQRQLGNTAGKGNLNNEVSPNNAGTYTLTATGQDYDSSNLYYDWSWINWVPDYSQQIGTASYQSQSGLAPPSTGCTASDGSAISGACFKSGQSYVVGSLNQIQRVVSVDINNQANYKYAVLSTVTPPGTQSISNWMRFPANTAGSDRVQKLRFMKLAPRTPAAQTTSVQLGTVTGPNYGTTKNLTIVPSYTQGRTINNAFVPNPDFNGFNANGGSTVNTASNVAGNSNFFLPNTQFKAYVFQQIYFWQTTDTLWKITDAPQANLVRDLVYCQIQISQKASGSGSGAKVPAYGTNTATLQVSSFGTCRGMWTFKLTVYDGCSSATDTFNLNVGCNRVPKVSAGCSNTQTWAGSAFQQVNLDGRASYDPDNFADKFYNLTTSIGGASLTYAWVIKSGPGYNAANAAGTCPFNPKSKCTQSYCNANQIKYWSVNPATGVGSSTSLTANTAANYKTSLQGMTNVWTAYGKYPQSYNYNSSATGVALGQLQNQATLSAQTARLFPEYTSACAPTVFPQFFQSDGTQTAPQQVINAQHLGQSAFMVNLTRAGDVQARLYAFDGCSVSYADVTVTTSCPTLDTSNVPNNLGMKSATKYIMFVDTTAGSGAAQSNAVQFFIPQDVTLTYAGLPDVPVTITLTVTGPNNFKQVIVSDPKFGPGTSRVVKLTNKQITIPGNPANVGQYTVAMSISDGCGRASGSAFSHVINKGTVATFNVECPYFVNMDYVKLTSGGNFEMWNQTQAVKGNTNFRQTQNALQFTARTFEARAFVQNNTGVVGNNGILTNFAVDLKAMVYYQSGNPQSFSNVPAPNSGGTYGTLVKTVNPSNPQNANGNTTATFTLSAGYRQLSITRMVTTTNTNSATDLNRFVHTGTDSPGYPNFQSASGDVNNIGSYKVVVQGTPKVANGNTFRGCTTGLSSGTVFGVGCTGITQLQLNQATNINGVNVANQISGTTLTSNFAKTTINAGSGGSWGDGTYNGGVNIAQRYANYLNSVSSGAFTKIGITARGWANFQCGSAGCNSNSQLTVSNNLMPSTAQSSSIGTNVNYQFVYTSGNQNPLTLSPYSAFNLAFNQLINPNGFSSDPNILVPTFPGSWTVNAYGVDPCQQATYTASSFTSSNSANGLTFSSTSVNAQCQKAVMPYANLKLEYDFSNRADTSNTQQPAFQTCSVSRVPFASRRLLQTPTGQSTFSVSCGNCNSNWKQQWGVTMYFDSFNVATAYATDKSDTRNFNDMGIIAGQGNSKTFPYGNGRAFVGRFPTLKMTVTNTTNAAYVAWYTGLEQISIPSGNCQIGNTVNGAANSQWTLTTGCNYLFTSSLQVGGQAFNAPISGQFNSGTQSAQQTYTVTPTVAGTTNYQVFVWNGPPGLSCYDYRMVSVCAVCNSITVGSISSGSSTWDGTKFPSVGLKSTVTYTQKSTTNSGTTTIPGNYFSLVYSWMVTKSPMGSQLRIPYGTDTTNRMAVNGQNYPASAGAALAGKPMMEQVTTTAQPSNNVSTYTASNGVQYQRTWVKQTTVKQYQRTQTTVLLTNHHFSQPQTCLQPDVEGSYGVTLSVTDGCTTQSQQQTVQASCNALPNNPTFNIKSASGATGSVSNGAAALTVKGDIYDRITVRATVAPSGSDELTYYWRVENLVTNATTTVMNGQGTLVSFFASDIPRWWASNTVNYRVTLVASSNCPDYMGMRKQASYSFNLMLTCNPNIQTSNIVFPEVTVNSTDSYTLRSYWWGGSLNKSLTFGNATTDPTSVSCSLSGGPMGGPSRFCGVYGGSSSAGVPTVLYTSTEYGFRNAFFNVQGSYTTDCNVKSTFWQLSSMACALPYNPTYTIRYPAPKMCKPKVTAYWTIASTPCGYCPKTNLPLCQFAEYQNYISYTRPTTMMNGNNNIWPTCVYAANQRLAAVKNAQFCTTSGEGLQTEDGPTVRFMPNFPGKYVLNYTVTDGCNPSSTTQVTITAQCVTKTVQPTLNNMNSDYYCNGENGYNADVFAGKFQQIDLRKMAHYYPNFVTSSSFNAPTPFDVSQKCTVIPARLTCKGLETTFNGLNFDQSVSTGNLANNNIGAFKYCCNCLYSLQIINPSGGQTPSSPGSTTPSSSGSTTPSGSSPGSTTPSGSSSSAAAKKAALAAEEVKRKRNEDILIGLAVPLGIILVASMLLNGYMMVKMRAQRAGTGGFNVEAGDVELSTSPSRHMDV